MDDDPGRISASPLPPATKVARAGMVARWKPVHLGHASVLRALVLHADCLLVGLGSSNRYDVRNPFTAAESEEMIRAILPDAPDLRFITVPDLGNGPRWRLMVADLMGPLDLFVTANPFVRDLMQDLFPVLHPAALLRAEERRRLDGTTVRYAMARGEGWRDLVPPEVARLLDEKGIPARFRREFGLETLALASPHPID
jgi:nicotinamide-nucleotide adenylyltransferase